VSGHLSPDEVRAQSIAAMPPQLGEIHHKLHDEVALLHLGWKDFRALFATSPNTVDLLNATAPTFFYNLQRMMWEDILLHLCRITDPPKSAGKDTLTIRRMPALIPELAVRNQLQLLTDVASGKAKFARDWRNRRLAHKELPPLDGTTPLSLAPASRQDVETALAAVRETLNFVESHYLNRPVRYEHAIEGTGGVEALVAHLRKSL
jgi:AbiU2